MSSKNNLNSQNQYNPAAMGAYNSFQPQMQAAYTSMLQNPLASSFFNQQYNAGLKNSQQGVLRNNTNTLQNLKTGGGLLSNSGAYTSALLNKNMLSGSVSNSNAFTSALGSAMGNRNFALQSMQGYQPLQTGMKSQTFQSGVGQYIQPAIAAGLNVAMPGLGSVMGGGSFSGGYQANPFGGGGANLSMMQGNAGANSLSGSTSSLSSLL